MDIVIYLFILVVLILLSSFFSSVEIAIFSLSHVDVSLMVNKGLKGAKQLHKLKENPNRLLVTILIGNNLVNILASSVATMLAIETFGSIGVGIATGIMTFMILVFGEVVPKTLAVKHAEKFSLRVSGTLLIFEKIIFPFVYVLELLANRVARFFDPGHDVNPIKSLVSEEKIKHMIVLGEKEGFIESDEKDMINNVFKLNDIVADNVMIRASEVESISIDTQIDNFLNKVSFKRIPYSRIPIFKGSEDNIVGVFYLKDMLKYLGKKKNSSKITLAKFMRKPFKIHPHVRADDLLDEFRRRKVHMAIVVDEFDKFIGVVTMEDLLEELVGDIMDESDVLRERL